MWEGHLLNLFSNSEGAEGNVSTPFLRCGAASPPREAILKCGRVSKMVPYFREIRRFHSELVGAPCGPLLVSSAGDAGSTENVLMMSKVQTHRPV